MKTNLIQNYISNNNIQMGNSQQQNYPQFSVNDHLYNRNFIKPLPPKAKLVNGSIFNAPAELVKDWAYEAKALKDGISGKANDHELGKLNDVGMKLGGLAIACYLAARKSTPLTKAMEFIGLGSFLAAMQLWPKLAIQLPAKLIHNINTRQAYEDSDGRKKPFGLDPQFLPFDLLSDKKIDKIGNWQGVPKDLPNRREFIQEKMRKEIVQNNTLWMLTAGFATPVMSGLMCNALTPFVEKKISIYDNKMNERMLEKFPDSVKTAMSDGLNSRVESFIKLNKDRPIDENFIKDLSKILTRGSNLVLADGINADIKNLLANDKFIIDNSITEHINKNIIQTLAQSYDEEIVKQIVPTKKQLSEIFENGNYLNNAYTPKEHRKLITKIRETLIKNVEEFNNTSTSIKLPRDYIEDLVSNVDIAQDPIKKGLKKVPARIFDESTQQTVRKISQVITKFKAQEAVLHRYAYKKVAHASDSTLAFEYNQMASKLVKILNIDPKEFENARYDRELMNKVIRKTFERIASSKEEYSKVMGELADVVSGLSTNIKDSDIGSYKNHLANSFRESAGEFSKLNMKHTVSSLIGLNPGNGKGSYQKVMENFVSDRLNGVKYAMYRVINTLDLYRRIATLENASVLTDPSVLREIKEEHLEMAKRESLQAHSSDYAIKFYDPRNPHPYNKNLGPDTSNIEIDKTGNPIFKYFGKQKGKKVDIPQDYKYYQGTMDLMNGAPMHSETQAILSPKNLLDKLNDYRKDIIEILGGEKYFIKPRHIAKVETDSTSNLRFLLTGISLDELFSKIGKQKYNTKKWLKMFGGFGAGLLAVTVGAQFLFGRVKLPENNNKVQTNA